MCWPPRLGTATRLVGRWRWRWGFGKGEALGLAWGAVDLDVGTLRVQRALQRQTGAGLVIVEPKSRAGRRTIVLPEQLVEALKAHRAAQLAERLRAGSEWQDRGRVFAQENGRPIDPRADYGMWGGY